jgi:hypothetical protein
MTPESFIEFFRTRHGWRCRPGSAIFADLSTFAIEHAESEESYDNLYVVFCAKNGITPKSP